MLQSKKEKYILFGLLLVLASVFIWRVSLYQMRKSAQPVRICVVAARDSEQEYRELMAGIRDYARENQVEIRVFYQEGLRKQELEKLLEGQKSAGIYGVLLIHPEDFMKTASDETQITAGVPVLKIGGEDTDRSASAGRQKSLEQTEIQELLDGKRAYITIVNEYKMGYMAIKMLSESPEKPVSEVKEEELKITVEDILSGKYNSLLSD